MSPEARADHIRIVTQSLDSAVRKLGEADTQTAEAYISSALFHLQLVTQDGQEAFQAEPAHTLGHTLMKCSVSGDDVRKSAHYWLNTMEADSDFLIRLVGQLSAYAPDKTALYAQQQIQRIRNNRHQTPAAPEGSCAPLSVNSGAVGCAEEKRA